MAVSPKQFVRARISRAKFRQLLKLFALDLTATQGAALTGLNRNTASRYLTLIRQAVAPHCERRSPFSGEVELDGPYFGARGKTIVSGTHRRNGRAYTGVVPDCGKASLPAIIRGEVELAAAIRTDGFRPYGGVAHAGYREHYRVRHGRGELARGTAHIDGAEGFWGRRRPGS